MPPVQNIIYYDSFIDCTMACYGESLNILQAFPIKEFEDKKLYTSFACTIQGTT